MFKVHLLLQMLIGGRVNVRTTSNFFQQAASSKAPGPPLNGSLKLPPGEWPRKPEVSRLVRESTVPGPPPYNKRKGIVENKRKELQVGFRMI